MSFIMLEVIAMEFPLNQILDVTIGKYEIASAMLKYAARIEEQPELLLEYSAKDQQKRLKIIFHDIFNKKVKYKINVN